MATPPLSVPIPSILHHATDNAPAQPLSRVLSITLDSSVTDR
ncbi:hypothetical protein [Streptomyces cyaneofuscatus]